MLWCRQVATMLLGVWLVLGASPVWAVSLGEIEVSSALNQPFVARIPVRGIDTESASTLRASMATAEAFQRAGLRREALHDDISVELTEQSGSSGQLELRSKRRIGEPFLSFLIELKWATGNVVREYTVLLDPATTIAGTQREPDDSVSTNAKPVRATGGSERNYANAGGRSYGPTSPQETLWSIALANRPDPSITMDQMQLAIFQANPQAFDGNINRMLKGVTLQIPDADSIRAIDPITAKSQVRRQARGGRSTATAYRRPAPYSSGSSRPAARPAATTRRRDSTSAGNPAIPPEVTAIAQAPANSEPVMPTAPATPQPEPAVAQTPPAEPATPAESAQTAAPAAAPAVPPSSTAPATPAVDEAPVTTPSVPPNLAPDSAPVLAAAGASPGPATAPKPAAAAPAVDPAGAATAAANTPGGVDAEETANPSPGLETPTIWAEGQTPPASTATPAQVAAPVPAPPATAPVPATPTPDPFAEESLSDQLPILPILALLVMGIATLLGVRAYRSRRAQRSDATIEPVLPFDADDLTSPIPSGPGGVWQGEAGAGVPAKVEAPAPVDLDALFGPDPMRGATRATQFADKSADKSADLQARDIPVRETDYIGEAELHIAYGLYDEAAAVLERGVQEDAQRNDLWMKLLEVHAEAKNPAEFAAVAERYRARGRPTEADLRKIADWSKGLGGEVISTPAPAVSATIAAPVAAAATAPAMAKQPETLELEVTRTGVFSSPPPVAKAPAKPVDDVLEFDLSDFELPASKPAAPAVAPVPAAPAVASASAPAAATDDSLDFDLSSFDLPSAPPAAAPPRMPVTAPASPAVKTPESSLLDDLALTDDLDFKLDIPPVPEVAAVATASDNSLGSIDLASLMDADPGSNTAMAVESAVGSDEEVGVKLDLARAYLDMGETDMAKSLLEEVSRVGNAQQRDEAQELLTRH